MIDLPDVFDGLPFGVLPFSDIRESLLAVRSISRLPENAESVICVLFPYYLGEDYYKNINISRYAVSLDYHEICGARLNKFAASLSEMYPENSFVPFIDSSPIPEVTAAQRCGLGLRGKHTLLINEKYGSWLFIGEIVSDLQFKSTPKELKGCSGCGACARACPCGAIGEVFDTERCISFITQKKGELTPEQTRIIREGGSAWGCDICQRACPHNIKAERSPIAEFYKNTLARVNTDDKIDGRAYAWRGEAVIKRNLGITAENDLTEGDT